LQKELKLKIISESINNGVTVTCKKYSISRTVYYRWLKRYQRMGVEGLEDIKKDFTPSNKTSLGIERTILDLVKIYPSYGPKALNYLLEELGHKISVSAVYNVLKRYQLSNKHKRIQFSKKREQVVIHNLPPISQLNSGECWIFWITDIGGFETYKKGYTYTLFDLKSRIACSRIYPDLSFNNFEEVLASVALSVATSLELKISYLCFFNNCKILKRFPNSFKGKIYEMLKKHGRNVKVDFLKDYCDLETVIRYKEDYNRQLLTTLLHSFNSGKSLGDTKKDLRNFIKDYNLNFKVDFGNISCSPVDYHNKTTNNKLILPLWAYIDREY